MRILKKILGVSLVVVFLLGKNAWGMEDDAFDKNSPTMPRLSCAASYSLEKDLKNLEVDIYQRLVTNEIDQNDVWALLFECRQRHYGKKSHNTHEILAHCALQMAVRYRLPLIARVMLTLPEAALFSVDVIKNLLFLMASSTNQIFPRTLKTHFFYQLIKLPQIKKFTVCEATELVNKLLDEKTVNVDVLRTILSHFSNFFTPAL